MTLFAGDAHDQPRGRKRRRRKPAAPAPGKATPTPAAKSTAPVPAGPLALSAAAQAVYDEIAGEWQLTPPVRALLRLACEALTKAEAAEAITAAEGLTIGDAKGAAKPHPAALLARDYRAQASTALQRILSALG